MGILRKIYYLLSPTMRFAARRIYYFPLDLYEGITGKRDGMIPPRGMIFIGARDFREQGIHILELLKTHADLKPDSYILDVGCGIGRAAVALTGYLNNKGAYEGFDIVKKGIDWCNKHIASRYPNFSFKHIDLKNDLYNLKTQEEAKNFIFPYEQESFDCIVLTSVFTHMMPADVNNYFKQIASVLKNNGKCLATFFLINPEIRKKMKAGKTQFNFTHSFEGYSLMDKSVKEANVAYDEDYLFSLLDKHGLEALSIHHGRWSYSPEALDFQDVVIISRKQKESDINKRSSKSDLN